MTQIVLIAQELFSKGLDPEALKRTAESADIRFLVHATVQPIPADFAAAVAATRKQADWLLKHDVEAPAIDMRRCVQMPADAKATDQEELALALSDCVLKPDGTDTPSILHRAKELRKSIVVCGKNAPSTETSRNLHEGLDPDVFRWGRWWPCLAGRLEQGILELWALERSRVHDSSKRLWKTIRFSGLCPEAFFAPDKYKKMRQAEAELDPPEKAGQPAGQPPIRAAFDCFDRSALYGSFVHRDVIWSTHLSAAFAVFAAVAGKIAFLGKADNFWPWTELAALLFVIGITWWSWRANLQHRWMACRFAAEQLRIARMCLPLLVVPSTLATVDKRKEDPYGPEDTKREKDEFATIAAVKRAVREQGLPHFAMAPTTRHDKEWLDLIVADQHSYHQKNHRKLKLIEDRLLRFNGLIFLSAIGAVIAHLGFHCEADWLLFFTAGFPATAAAIHGAQTRLGVVHRAALSEQMEEELEEILCKIRKLPDEPSGVALRHLARLAGEAMARENTSWHNLIRRVPDALPT
jgi:hypothetical protein